MKRYDRFQFIIAATFLVALFGLPNTAVGQINVATTTLFISICGDEIVGQGEECDIPTDIGEYSTTIAGRQCNSFCQWAPYCGDAVLNTVYGEECDDGNNANNDFCAEDCTEEEADAGGGSTGGGGSSAGSGGRSTPLGDTQVTVEGKAYPNRTVNILIDGDSVGSVRSNSRAEFLFTTETDPGTASLSFWATDSAGTRSTTFNTTFDITQGAVTNVTGILIPPTLRVTDATVDPGDVITISGQTVPDAAVEVSVDDGDITLETTANASGNWSATFDTSRVSIDTHTLKARFSDGLTESTYGTTLSLFVGVEGQAVSNADLNRDGFVNLIDFSILVFWWGTPGGNSDPPADINQNGNVSLEDFSILLFNWTG